MRERVADRLAEATAGPANLTPDQRAAIRDAIRARLADEVRDRLGDNLADEVGKKLSEQSK
jgi:hypothetical protein